MRLRVSIIINNYNYARFLGQAIDSSLNQTYSEIEVIVVDDGSQDGSREIILGYGDRIVPVLKPNGGQASAMNAGFRVSKGEIIVFLDADDYFFPHAVDTIVSQWMPGIAQMQARLESRDAEGNYIDLYPAPEIAFNTGDVTPLLLTKGRYNTTVTSGTSFSRMVLEKILPIPEADFRISADGYLVSVSPFYGQVFAIETPIGVRRKHGENLWAASSQEIDVSRFRKSLQHDRLRYQAIAGTAKGVGRSLDGDPGLKDTLHLTDRLVSLKVDPRGHLYPTDSCMMLAWKGFWAVWKYSTYSRKRKLILSLWFLWVGYLPVALAKPAIAWFLLGKSRPRFVDKLVKQIRTATS
ncbi:glycosyltransferase family 2 protein [Leptolyngbya sp. O-77]|uniref:glycosyltransferase family 2 protein n=1 Tax=Leptolyngbya sp. O-77 TaxID=1080068 RepID=UPI00074D34D2|nr:glycosyltransferase [Leptolyngbya sp. O-77]BAU42659.1 Hyaluronan synthase [Leptolyngbya sp. O-77]